MRCIVTQQTQRRLWDRPEDASFEELLSALLICGFGTKSALELSRKLARLARTEKGLLYLDPETIASISGMGQARVSALVAAVELARRLYSNEWAKGKEVNLDNLASHLQTKLEGLGREYFYLFSFNRSFGLIQEHILARGSTEAVNVYFRDILKVLLNDRASKTLIAHNHPDQSANASDADMESMAKLEELLDELGIVLVDQYIVGTDGVYSCKKAALLDPIKRNKSYAATQVS